MQIIGLTDIGNGRKVNEDDYFFTTEQVGDLPNLCLVADGLGGHKAGEVASRMAIDSIVNYCLSTIEPNLEKLLLDAFQHANVEVYEYAKNQGENFEMGTTMVGVTILEDYYVFINIGDSRAYLFREGELKKITKDHSPVQELQEMGVITEEEAFCHTHRNLISRAIGMEEKIKADVYTVPSQPNDIILLCTDGLSNYMRRQEMAKVINQENNIKEMAHQLVKGALNHEARDNITVLLVAINQKGEDDLC